MDMAWLKKAIETIQNRIADKLEKDNIKLGYYLPKKCETLNIIDVNIYESSSTKLF